MIEPRLKVYLETLRAGQLGKPQSERKVVPTLMDISRGTGLAYTALSRIANGRGKRLDFESAIRIISFVRSLGHDMNVNDLILYVDRGNSAT